MGRDPGQLLVDDRANVGLGAVRPAAKLGRHGMGAEVGRHDLRRALHPKAVGRLDQPDLSLEIEPVAGLGLHRGHAMPEHLVQPAPAVREQLLGRGGPGRGDRREDASPGGQDLQVASALLTQQQLAFTRPREEEVRMGIDEARGDRSTGGVEASEAPERIALALEYSLDVGS